MGTAGGIENRRDWSGKKTAALRERKMAGREELSYQMCGKPGAPSSIRKQANCRVSYKSFPFEGCEIGGGGENTRETRFGTSTANKFYTNFSYFVWFRTDYATRRERGWFSLRKARGMMDRKHSSVRFFRKIQNKYKGMHFRAASSARTIFVAFRVEV